MEKYKIIYEDDDILVVHKMPGISVETAKIGEKDLVSELKRYLKRTSNSSYLGVIHRLDQPVEGVIVFAKNSGSAGILSKMVADKNAMDKIYLASVYGHMKDRSGRLEDFLLKDNKANASKVVGPKDGGKKAILEYEVIESDDYADTVKVRLLTGRHHQIRVQLANAGCPILGDAKYGNDMSVNYSKDNNIRNIMLVAAKLSFAHPKSGSMMEFAVREGV